jgi:hypothetical protein
MEDRGPQQRLGVAGKNPRCLSAKLRQFIGGIFP